MAIDKRQQRGSSNYDLGTVAGLTFSQAAGAQKITEVGRSLLPLGDGAAGFTTDASTARILPAPGRNLAVYNNSGSVGAVTVSKDPAVAALAPGAVSAAGDVGVPCAPNSWTFIAASENIWVRSTAQTLLVFLIEDETYIRPQITV